MQDDGRLLARTRNARAGLTVTAGMHLLVGCEDAEPAEAQVVSVAANGSIELRVLPGAAGDHLTLVESVGLPMRHHPALHAVKWRRGVRSRRATRRWHANVEMTHYSNAMKGMYDRVDGPQHQK